MRTSRRVIVVGGGIGGLGLNPMQNVNRALVLDEFTGIAT